MRFSDTVSKIVERVFTLFTGVDRDNLYGLDHAILHVEVPPKGGMWMNMGYWKHTDNLPEACEALLDQILIAANLVSEDKAPMKGDNNLRPEPATQGQIGLKLVDVGIGCGDQTLYLMRQLSKKPQPSTTTTSATTKDSNHRETRCWLDSYVGMTIAQSQANLVQERLAAKAADGNSASLSSEKPKMKIFAADAANPPSWSPEIKNAIFGDPETRSKDSCDTETWLLALDTLYHFKPSRKPLFKCAYGDMEASLMGFDLVLSDSASLWNKLILRLICAFSGMPYSNFVTKDGYQDMLIRAGYERQMIEMHDVSEHVFSGLAKYLVNKDLELKRYGMTIGKFKGAAKVFSWWATSGLVRGVVFVARRSSKP
ncbi:hypothetical protein FE257_009378 [Aspergillus nanangensis]|uniref:Uncharacterized protein n=1 Tax=Aspergillus nanangensis TaxID=2582783 RepID=A0AAD4CK25_ASPNN|nr:hypothetical protein FE257_009378 [Aspergillus nanangensis]